MLPHWLRRDDTFTPEDAAGKAKNLSGWSCINLVAGKIAEIKRQNVLLSLSETGKTFITPELKIIFSSVLILLSLFIHNLVLSISALVLITASALFFVPSKSAYLKKTAGLSLISIFLTFPASLSFFSGGENVFYIFSTKGVKLFLSLMIKVTTAGAILSFVRATTSFSGILSTLKILKVPEILIQIVYLSFKYLELFLITVLDMHRARLARQVYPASKKEERDISAANGVFFLQKVFKTGEDIHKAMLARGING